MLCAAAPAEGLDVPPLMAPRWRVRGRPEIAEAARLLAAAEHPVIFAQHGAGSAEAFAALSALAGEWGIPVCQYWALALALPTDHPMAAPPDPAPLLTRADVILVVDALAPWSPAIHAPAPGVPVIHLGPDPLATRVPVRNFRSDLSIVCETADGILALKAAMAGPGPRRPWRRVARPWPPPTRRRARGAAAAAAGRDGVMTKEWVSLCLSRALAGHQATVLSELGCPLPPMELDHYRAGYQEPHAGGLGWSFPAGLGMCLADRDRLVVATMGDGSLHLREPGRLPPGRRGAGPAGPRGDPQQRRVGGGAPVGARHLSGRPCRPQQRDAADRARAGPPTSSASPRRAGRGRGGSRRGADLPAVLDAALRHVG